jgi:ABC-type polysaccharide/polyol phosphate export permease
LGAWDWVLYLNPFVSMAEGFRLAFFGIGDLAELHVPGITLSFAMGCLLIFFGRLALQWVDRNLVDRL